MATLGSLVVDLKADTAAFRRDIQAARSSTQQLHKGLTDMGEGLKRTVAGFLTIRFAVQAVKEIATATMEAEQATARLEGVLKATGFSAGLTADQIDKLASAMQDNTLFQDEEVKNAAAALATFQRVQGNVFRDAIALAGDLATIFGGGLQENAVKLGKALNDPIEGLGALSRVGVRFTDGEQEKIKALVESNRLLDAQAIILEKLTDKVGGAAKAMGETGLTGAVNQVKDAFSEMLETIGGSKFGEMLARQAEFTANQFREIGGMFGGSGDEIDALMKKQKEWREELTRLEGRGDRTDAQVAHARMMLRLIADEIELNIDATRALEDKAKAGAKSVDLTTGRSAADLKADGERYRQLVEESVRDNIMTLRSLREWRDDENARLKKDAEDAKRIQDDLLRASLAVDQARLDGAQDAALRDVKIWNNAIENIQDDWSDSFADMLTGQITTFREFLHTMFTDFARTMAQMGSARLAAGIFGGFMQSDLTLPAGGPSFGGFNNPTLTGPQSGFLGSVASGSGASGRPVIRQTFNFSAIDAKGMDALIAKHAPSIAIAAAAGARSSQSLRRRFARGTD